MERKFMCYGVAKEIIVKTCSSCKEKYTAKVENFSIDRKRKDGLSSWCRVCSRGAARRYNSSSKGKLSVAASKSKFNASVKGKLSRTYHNILQRCNATYGNVNDRQYNGKGIECKFGSAAELFDYVVNVMEVDPRGKVCHRIDNDGHYERGNIEFLTRAEHVEVHVAMREVCV